jgi:hypothetical protein
MTINFQVTFGHLDGILPVLPSFFTLETYGWLLDRRRHSPFSITGTMSSHNEPLTGTWTRLLSSDRLRRSSHVLSAIGSDACIFGGERLPRQPVDNKVDALTLSPGT